MLVFVQLVVTLAYNLQAYLALVLVVEKPEGNMLYAEDIPREYIL